MRSSISIQTAISPHAAELRVIEYIFIYLNNLIFFFYYWSGDNEIRFAVLGIDLKKAKTGKLIYLQRTKNDEFEITHESNIESIAYEDSDTFDVILRSKRSLGATFLSVHLGSIEITDIKIAFCSYCGAKGAHETQFAGVGILHGIPKQEFETKLNDIKNKGINPNIVNVLYRKRFDLSLSEADLFEKEKNIDSYLPEPLKLVQDLWIGYYLRRMRKSKAGRWKRCSTTTSWAATRARSRTTQSCACSPRDCRPRPPSGISAGSAD